MASKWATALRACLIARLKSEAPRPQWRGLLPPRVLSTIRIRNLVLDINWGCFCSTGGGHCTKLSSWLEMNERTNKQVALIIVEEALPAACLKFRNFPN